MQMVFGFRQSGLLIVDYLVLNIQHHPYLQVANQSATYSVRSVAQEVCSSY